MRIFMAEERNARDIIAGASLNEYERNLLFGFKQTRGSKAVKSKVISEAITGVLNADIEIDGEQLTVAEALTVKVIGDALANPSTSKMKDLASIIGDVGTTKVEILTSQVDEDLARAAIGEAIDGEE